MQVTEEIVGKGVVEQRFHFEADGEEVPGIAWRPEGSDGPDAA